MKTMWYFIITFRPLIVTSLFVFRKKNAFFFIQKVRKYAELAELTPYAAHELIKAIYVGASDKSSGKRRQNIHICYDLIGFIPLSELMEQEMA